MVVSVRTERVGMAIGAILMACSGAGADITASLTYPGMQPAWHDADRSERVLDPKAGVARVECLNGLIFAPINADCFERDVSGPRGWDADESEKDASQSSLQAEPIELSWDAMRVDGDDGWSRARGLLLRFGEEADGSTEPVFHTLPAEAIDFQGASDFRLVSY